MFSYNVCLRQPHSFTMWFSFTFTNVLEMCNLSLCLGTFAHRDGYCSSNLLLFLFSLFMFICYHYIYRDLNIKKRYSWSIASQ